MARAQSVQNSQSATPRPSRAVFCRTLAGFLAGAIVDGAEDGEHLRSHSHEPAGPAGDQGSLALEGLRPALHQPAKGMN